MIRNARSCAGLWPEVLPLEFEDFAVSWAGVGRHDDEFCFG